MSAKVAFTLFTPLAAALSASFTHYGAGDGWGSQNCKTPPSDRALACGPGTEKTVTGYGAAISQNYYNPSNPTGHDSGVGAGCGQCWEISIESADGGSAVAPKNITVQVNNECPAEGNPEWCTISAGGTNTHQAEVHFDLCSDDGASAALLGSSGTGKGTATQVSCSGGGAAAPVSAASQPSSAASSAAASSAYSAPAQSAPAQSYSAPDAASSAAGAETSQAVQPTQPAQAPPASYGGSSETAAAAGASDSAAFPLPSHGGSEKDHPHMSFPGGQYGASNTAAGASATGFGGFPGGYTPGATPTPRFGRHGSHGRHGRHGYHGADSPYGPQGGSSAVSAAAAATNTAAAAGENGEECPDEAAGQHGGQHY